MADPFIGEIRAVPYNFAPRGWADCDGQILSIAQNTALFSLLGTMYGGDGKSNFALPDFRDRVAVHHGQGNGLSEVLIGESGGTSTTSLGISQIAPHFHTILGDGGKATSNDPSGKLLAVPNVAGRLQTLYNPSADGILFPFAVSQTGQGLPHNNMQPYLGLRYIIALTGIFPQRS